LGSAPKKIPQDFFLCLGFSQLDTSRCQNYGGRINPQMNGAHTMTDQKYKFSWELLGNINLARPNLGPNTRLEVYRLMQGTFREILEQHFGTDMADQVFYESGKLAGEHFYKHVIGEVEDFGQMTKALEQSMLSLGMGVLRIEESDFDKGTFVLTVSEDLDCSGLPELGYLICTYDEGFIAGIFESFTGKTFRVKEIDCWCTGERTCRFEANVAQ